LFYKTLTTPDRIYVFHFGLLILEKQHYDKTDELSHYFAYTPNCWMEVMVSTLS